MSNMFTSAAFHVGFEKVAISNSLRMKAMMERHSRDVASGKVNPGEYSKQMLRNAEAAQKHLNRSVAKGAVAGVGGGLVALGLRHAYKKHQASGQQKTANAEAFRRRMDNSFEETDEITRRINKNHNMSLRETGRMFGTKKGTHPFDGAGARKAARTAMKRKVGMGVGAAALAAGGFAAYKANKARKSEKTASEIMDDMVVKLAALPAARFAELRHQMASRLSGKLDAVSGKLLHAAGDQKLRLRAQKNRLGGMLGRAQHHGDRTKMRALGVDTNVKRSVQKIKEETDPFASVKHSPVPARAHTAADMEATVAGRKR